MMNHGDPLIKLMVIGKVNEKLKNMISQPALSDIDIKLLKGIFFRRTTKPPTRKGLLDTFSKKTAV